MRFYSYGFPFLFFIFLPPPMIWIDSPVTRMHVVDVYITGIRLFTHLLLVSRRLGRLGSPYSLLLNYRTVADTRDTFVIRRCSVDRSRCSSVRTNVGGNPRGIDYRNADKRNLSAFPDRRSYIIDRSDTSRRFVRAPKFARAFVPDVVGAPRFVHPFLSIAADIFVP